MAGGPLATERPRSGRVMGVGGLVVVGTRPEAIKIALMQRVLAAVGPTPVLVSIGQHADLRVAGG